MLYILLWWNLIVCAFQGVSILSMSVCLHMARLKSSWLRWAMIFSNQASRSLQSRLTFLQLTYILIFSLFALAIIWKMNIKKNENPFFLTRTSCNLSFLQPSAEWIYHLLLLFLKGTKTFLLLLLIKDQQTWCTY